MEIKFNTEIQSVARTTTGASKPTAGTAADGQLSLTNSKALDQALAAAPDVRPDAVEKGKALIASVPYPPLETIHRIARLLAYEMAKSQN